MVQEVDWIDTIGLTGLVGLVGQFDLLGWFFDASDTADMSVFA